MINLNKLLNEQSGKFSYGCVMLYFSFPELGKLQKTIKEEDIYTDPEGERSFGLEDEPHITLLYGLHDEVTLDSVKKVLNKYSFSTCRVFNSSLFVNPKYDVLKFDVEGPELFKVNKALAKFPNTNDFPDYHPHMTIAYIKPGKGGKYASWFNTFEYNLTPSYAVYSTPSGDKHEIDINVE